jgi:hypothetical protein
VALSKNEVRFARHEWQELLRALRKALLDLLNDLFLSDLRSYAGLYCYPDKALEKSRKKIAKELCRGRREWHNRRAGNCNQPVT